MCDRMERLSECCSTNYYEDCQLMVAHEECIHAPETLATGKTVCHEDELSSSAPSSSPENSGRQNEEDVPLDAEDNITNAARNTHDRCRCDYIRDEAAYQSTESVWGSACQSCMSDSTHNVTAIPTYMGDDPRPVDNIKHIHDFHKYEFMLHRPDDGDGGSIDGSEHGTGSEQAPRSTAATYGSVDDKETDEGPSSEATCDMDIGGLSDDTHYSSDEAEGKAYGANNIEELCGNIPSVLTLHDNKVLSKLRDDASADQEEATQEIMPNDKHLTRKHKDRYISEWEKVDDLSFDEHDMIQAIENWKSNHATEDAEKERMKLCRKWKKLHEKQDMLCKFTKESKLYDPSETTCKYSTERINMKETYEEDQMSAGKYEFDSESEWISVADSDVYGSSDESDGSDEDDSDLDADVHDFDDDIRYSLSIPNFDLHLARQPAQFTGELLDKLSDFTIIVKERAFRVHKILLAAISPLFLAAFLQDEQPIQRIVFDECDPDAMAAVIDYIYSGHITPKQYIKSEILEMIDQFAMGEDSLKFDEFSTWLYHRFDELPRYLTPGKERFSDLTVTGRKCVFSCHKVVLAAQCPYIASLLASDPTITHIDLSSYDDHTLSTVLRFFYKEDSVVCSDDLHRVLDLFDYLGVNYVNERADRFYTEHFTRDISLGYLFLAQQCRLPGLTAALEEFHTSKNKDNNLQTIMEFCLNTEPNPDYTKLLLLSLKWLTIDPEKHEGEFLQNLNQIDFQVISRDDFYTCVNLHKAHLHLSVVRDLCRHFSEHAQFIDFHDPDYFIVIGGENMAGSPKMDCLRIAEEIVDKCEFRIPGEFRARSGVITASDHEFCEIRLIGGKDRMGDVRNDVISCSASNEWTLEAPTLTARHSGQAVYVWDQIDCGPYLVVAGGSTVNNLPNLSMEQCHVGRGPWQCVPVPLFKLDPHHMLVAGSSISRAFFLVQPEDGRPYSLYSYQPAEGVWRVEHQAVDCDKPVKMTCIEEKLFIFCRQVVMVYNVTTGHWDQISSPLFPRPLSPHDLLVVCNREKIRFISQTPQETVALIDEETGEDPVATDVADDLQRTANEKPKDHESVQAHMQENSTQPHENQSPEHENNNDPKSARILEENGTPPIDSGSHEIRTETQMTEDTQPQVKDAEMHENGLDAQEKDLETSICKEKINTLEKEPPTMNTAEEENDESVYMYEYFVDSANSGSEWVKCEVAVQCQLPESFRNAAVAHIL